VTPERWRTVEDLFTAAVALPAGERTAFVAKACEGDPDLYQEVLSLLEHTRQSGDISSVVQEVAARFSEDDEGGLTGARIGAYRITGVIGRGGMGVVCAAVRDDEQFRKQAAIKLIKRGMDTAFIVSRFHAERQILAGLEHPGIARLIDGGATEDGQPYFVMEHVEGLPITEHCEARKLSIKERVRLFQLVCEAVQYAHRNLVIHRDLKPSNILVTAEGNPKLLDFGLAKVLAPRDEAPTLTLPAVKMLTPDYASPEQVRGERVSTATDVYSLGAVLYELLTGERPHSLKEYTPLEIEEAICRTEIERPSSVVLKDARRAERARRQWARQLKGDLDNIVLKAMRKEPERRYASVEQLSRDLQRYLEGRPVIARPDTAAYRIRKFVSRHKLPVAAAALAITSLAAGGIMTAYQARRAEQRFQQVRKLAKVFLFDLNDRLDPLPGSTDTRRFIAQTGLDYLASLERESGGDPELLQELAAAYRRVADVLGGPLQRNLGDTSGALASYHRAAAILERLGPSQAGREARILLAQTYQSIGAVQDQRGELRNGLETYRKALRIAEDLTSSGGEARALELAGSLHNGIARVLNRQGDIAAAMEHASAALSVHHKLVSMDAANRKYLAQLATSHRFVGTALEKTGKRSEALSHHLEALRIREAQVAREPANPALRRELMLSYSFLGDFLKSPLAASRDFEGALNYYAKMLDIAESLSRQDPRDRRSRSDVAQSLLRTGTVLADLTRYTEADRHFRRSLRITGELLAENPKNYLLRYNVSFLEERVAHTLLAQGKPTEAEPYARRAVDAAERLIRETKDSREPFQQALRSYATHVKTLAEIGDHGAVESSSARILELAAETSPEKESNQVTLYAAPLALAAAGEAHESLARRTGDSADRLARLKAACSWFSRSLERWTTLRNAGAAGVAFDSGRIEAEKRLTACEREVHRLRPAGQ
jgi:serine/threonine protein kinase